MTAVVLVSAGTGPVEVRAFVARLADRVSGLCRDAGLVVGAVACEGPDDAPRSVELRVDGGAAAVLAGELGTHELIARSPRRGRSARKRWFAVVSVDELGARCQDEPPAILDRDLVVTATRAGGPGGQHVNKVATAVRVHHVPSGIAVRVASERSQAQNLRLAVRRIARLAADEADARRRERSADRRIVRREVVRGGAIRTYRLGPRGELELVSPRARPGGRP